MTPPASGGAGLPTTVMPTAAKTGRTASNASALSWLPATTTTGATGAQGEERLPGQALGVGCGCRRVEDVAGHDDELDRLGGGDLDDLGHHDPLLGQPVDALQHLAQVPVAGVEDPHGYRPSKSASVAGST